MTFEKFARHNLIDCEDGYFYLDEYRRGADQMIFVHCRLHHWSPSILRKLRTEWALFRSLVTCDLYATADDETPKWIKFTKLFGFKPLMDVLIESGERRTLFINRTSDERQLNPINTINDDGVAVGCPNSISATGLPGRRERPEHCAE